VSNEDHSAKIPSRVISLGIGFIKVEPRDQNSFAITIAANPRIINEVGQALIMALDHRYSQSPYRLDMDATRKAHLLAAPQESTRTNGECSLEHLCEVISANSDKLDSIQNMKQFITGKKKEAAERKKQAVEKIDKTYPRLRELLSQALTDAGIVLDEQKKNAVLDSFALEVSRSPRVIKNATSIHSNLIYALADNKVETTDEQDTSLASWIDTHFYQMTSKTSGEERCQTA
jgi:hypothetical protein